MSGRPRRPLALVAALAAALALGGSPAAADGPSEYEVKAAFLYNFARYVEWPQAAFQRSGDPIVVGVLGEDPFKSALDRTLEGRMVGGRKLVARRVATADEASGCHILFVSASEEERLLSVLRALGSRSILTVGDMEGFSERGGAIGFVMEDKKVRFEINLGAAGRAGLKISSQLLKLAKVVRDEEKRRG